MSNDIIIKPLRNEKFIIECEKLYNLCSTSYGSSGLFKLLSDEEETITTSSSVIFETFKVSDALMQFLIAVTKSHINYYGDGGLSLPLKVTGLIKEFNRIEGGPALAFIHDFLSEKILDCLSSNSNWFKIKISFDNFEELLVVVESVISSKPSCQLTSIDIKMLSKLLTIAFINSIPNKMDTPENDARMGIIHFQRCCGLSMEQSKLEDGFAFPLHPELNNSSVHIIRKRFLKEGNYACLLFISPLDETLFSDLKQEGILFLSTKIIKSKVDIIACQKGIDPSLRLLLERNQILVLERLGTENTFCLSKLIGIKPHYVNSTNLNDFEMKTGLVTNIKIVEKSSIDNFIFFSNKSIETNFQTLIVGAISSQVGEETLKVLKQALKTLERLVKGKYCLPGAGCTEAILMSHLKNTVKSSVKNIAEELRCSEGQLLSTTDRFSVGILNAVKPRNAFLSQLFVDEIYSHLWLPDAHHCACGLVNNKMTRNLIPSATNCLNWPTQSFSLNPYNKSSNLKEVVLDEFTLRNAVFESVFETCSLFLRTGLCIYSQE